MKRILTIALITAITCGSAPAERRLVDTIAAVVGQEIILFSDIQFAVGSVLEEMKATTPPAEFEREATELMTETLNVLIENNILYREALRSGLNASDEAVERQVDQYFESLSLKTDEEKLAFLEESGRTMNDVRDHERKKLLATVAYRNKLSSVNESIVIGEDEVADYFDNHPDEFSRPERARVRQIMLRAPQDSDERKEAIARLEVLREEILNGASFEELAKKYSQLPGSEDGGIVAWLRRGDLVEELDEAAFTLEVGAVSEVLETQYGVHLLKVDERQAAGAVDLQAARAEIEPALRQQRANDVMSLWIADLKKTSNVRVYL